MGAWSWLRDSVINPIGHAVEDAGQWVGDQVSTGWDEITGKAKHEREMSLAQWQYDKEIEFWKMQNEYNSPVNQQARFAEAGLNPNLMYNQGNAGNASGSTHVKAPDSYGPVGNIMGVVQGLMGFKQMASNIKNMGARLMEIKENANLKSTQNARLIATLPYVGAQEKAKMIRLELGNQMQRSILPYVGDTQLARLDNLRADAELKDQLYKYRGEMNPLQKTALGQSIRKNDEMIELIQAKKVYEQNKAYFSNMGVMSYNNPIVMATTMALKGAGLLSSEYGSQIMEGVGNAGQSVGEGFKSFWNPMYKGN